MSIRVVKEPEGAGPPYERCCFCWRKTTWWHAKKDVAVCPECAKTHNTADIPKKQDWCEQTTGLDLTPMTTPSTSAQVLNVADRMREFMEDARLGHATVPVAHIAEWRKLISDLASPYPAASPASPSGDAVLTRKDICRLWQTAATLPRMTVEQFVGELLTDIDHRASLASDATPAPTSESEAVTDEMVERACRWHNVGWSKWHEPQKATAREVMRGALVRALAKPASEPAGVDVREAAEALVADVKERTKAGMSWGVHGHPTISPKALYDLTHALYLSSSAGPAVEAVAVIGFYENEREPRLLSWNKLPNGEHPLYAHPAPATVEMREEPLLSERDQKIVKDWLLATRSHRGGSRLGTLLAQRIADDLEADGVTEADIDRLFPAALAPATEGRKS